jgi:hypothetical protein
MRNGKRILSVKIKTMYDDSPDTSYLGEYSDKMKTDFAIDRAHDSNCPWHDGRRIQAQEGLDQLDHIQDALGQIQNDAEEWSAELEQASETVRNIREAEFECACIADDWDRREYRYFNATTVCTKDAANDNISNARQDYERMESLSRGDWAYVGIRAEAEIGIPCLANKGCVRGHEVYYTHTQKITSGGLWGIESDSDKDYLASVRKDELADLRGQLKALGFSARAISAAFRNVEETCE